jgi:hypothetical protein
MQVGKTKKESFYNGNWEFFFPLKSGKSGSFFPCKILCVDWNHIFQVKIWPVKETTLESTTTEFPIL